jgi:phage tail-like protein
MSEKSPNNYFFLNREGRWPDFQYSGLDLCDDGTLQLSSVPRLSTPLPSAVSGASAPSRPAGIAVDCTGALYFTEPDSDTLMCINACDTSVARVPCVCGGESGSPGQLHGPRGLLIPANRRVLLVADSGNSRIQIFDLDSFQLLEIWGGSGAAAGSQSGQFNTPWTLAGDSAGNVYVVDYGNQRVQKFNALGEAIPTFAHNVSASGLLHHPADIAAASFEGKTCIFVLDSGSSQILLFDDAGNPVLDSNGHPRVISDPHLVRPMGLAVSGDALYVGDNSAMRIFRLRIAGTFEFVGAAIGYAGPVAALSLDHKGNLWVHPGDSLTPQALATQEGFGTLGCLWHPEPVRVVGRKVVWHRLEALLHLPCPNAHLDLFAYASDNWADFPGVDPTAANPFQDPRWHALPSLANLDLTDIYIGNTQHKFLWIGALFSGDGSATPLLHQLRVEFDWPTLDQYLPVIYQKTCKQGDFLLPLLSLFQSFFGGIEHEIDRLPALFDPFAAPKRFLPWVAGLLGLDLDQNWTEAEQREIIGTFFEYCGKRGTSSGMGEALRLFAGVNAVIDEPILNAAWWALPSAAESCCEACASEAVSSGGSWENVGNSILGWTTMLPPAQPQGAVAGTSADLDQSHLITDEDFGAPLFTDVAYQFRVQVYRSELTSPDVLAKVRAVIDSEKPAHTLCNLCIIEPLFRVGFQGRVGIDTVVGGPPPSLALGSGQLLGVTAALAGPALNRLGDGSRVGVSTRLA